MKITINVPEGEHYPSTDIAYKGEFTKLTECQDCKTIQDYWSNNSPICGYCGGKLVQDKIGKWNKTLKKWTCR